MAITCPEFAMAAPVPLRTDFDAAQQRGIAIGRSLGPRVALTGEPVGLFRPMAPLTCRGSKLRTEFCPMARIIGKSFGLGSLFPVILSKPHEPSCGYGRDSARPIVRRAVSPRLLGG